MKDAELDALQVRLRSARLGWKDGMQAADAVVALREQVAALSKSVTKSDAAVVAKQLRDWSDADLRAESKVRDVSKANVEATLGYIAASVLESLDRTTDILAERVERAEADNAALRQLLASISQRIVKALYDDPVERKGIATVIDAALLAGKKP